jgi:hypothetical protein
MASFMSALWHFIADTIAFLWFSFIEPPVNEPAEVTPRRTTDRPSATLRLDEPPPQVLSEAREDGILVPRMYRRGTEEAVEDSVNESSFLSQLEQRTQQVKITLANLEAEKVRIEGLITQLQPVVPHYDALLEAERAISNANIALEQTHSAPERDSQQEPSWESKHQTSNEEPAESNWAQ